MAEPALTVESIRTSFPILKREVNGCPLVYCDSAATSLTPLEVMQAEAHFYCTIGANVHRGSHALALEASDAYEGARATIARFVGAATRQVVFTANATAALNLVAAGLPLDGDDEVLASVNDHHAALLPWLKRGRLRLFDAPLQQTLDVDAFRRALGPRTRAVVLTHASNVTGVVQAVRELCQVAREHGVLTIVDASQSAPHLPIDVAAMGCDFLALSGHKLLGPTGIGVLYGRDAALASLAPRDIGGGTVTRASSSAFTWSALPARLEPGTPNIAGAIGLAAATRYLERVGFAWMEQHHAELAALLQTKLGGLPGVRMLSSSEPGALPMASLSLSGLPTAVDVVAATLSDRYGVMVRSGLHCAHPLFERLELPDGALRASFYLYNTAAEVSYFCDSLAEILSLFG
ncbi:MAG: cysteine desulfurase, SufS subfamily [Myxococcaceae bacterium]|nr:cysteine desulfurase, SufS subfamily [Myxococcaceae bacterium]